MMDVIYEPRLRMILHFVSIHNRRRLWISVAQSERLQSACGVRILGVFVHWTVQLKCFTLAEKLLSPKVEILLGNAAQELPAADLFVCGFVMHELPYIARQAIIDNAYEGLSTGGLFLIVDISNSYVPKEMMLKGEPFVTEYLENFVGQLLMSPFRVESKTWIEGHVATYWCWKDGHSLDEASKNIW